MAEKILERRDSSSPQEFVSQTYSLTGDPRLISKAVPLGEQSFIAFTLLIQILRQTAEKAAGTKSVSAKAEPEPSKELAVSPIQPGKEGVEEAMPDYYSLLGVDKTAGQEEIRKAYRELMKEYHPDVLRAKGLSAEETAEITRKVQDINEAYKVLNSQQNRQNYDVLSKQQASLLPPQKEHDPESSLLISLNPTIKTDQAVDKALQSTAEFRKTVQSAGYLEFDSDTTTGLANSGLLPETYKGPELPTALRLHALGVRHENLVDEAGKAAFLLEEEKQQFYNTAYIMATFEESNPEQFIVLQTANLKPTITIQQASPEFIPQRNQFALERREEGGFQPVKELLGKGVDYAKGKVKDFASKAIKKGGEKLLEKGATVATKAGLSVATAGAEAAAGPAGWALLAAQLAKEVLSVVAKPLKKAFGKIATLLTGERDTKKQLKYLGVGLLLLGVITASTPFLAAGGGILILLNLTAIAAAAPAFMSLAAGAAASAIGAPVIIAVVLTPLIVAFLLFIINSGAYVVPPAPSLIPGSLDSPYIDVEKIPTPAGPFKNNQLPLSINYTITVIAEKGTLSNINFKYECRVIKSGSLPACPRPTNVTVNGESVSDSPFPPTPPGVISPVTNYILSYSVSYGSNFEDSVVVDTFTVTADTDEVAGAKTLGTASIVIGNPPMLCPIPGGKVNPRDGSYINGTESGGHGSNDYWNRMGGRPCRWGLPQGVCWGPSNPAASSNVCYENSRGACEFYGAAADVFAPGNTAVFVPTVEGKTVTWSCGYGWLNYDGYTFVCTSGQYKLILTHLNRKANEGTITSGQQFGTLFNQGGNSHVHIEFAINGQYKRPEDYFCF